MEGVSGAEGEDGYEKEEVMLFYGLAGGGGRESLTVGDVVVGDRRVR